MKDLEIYNCNGLACVSLDNYNDALEEILRLKKVLKEIEIYVYVEGSRLGLIGTEKVIDKIKELENE